MFSLVIKLEQKLEELKDMLATIPIGDFVDIEERGLGIKRKVQNPLNYFLYKIFKGIGERILKSLERSFNRLRERISSELEEVLPKLIEIAADSKSVPADKATEFLPHITKAISTFNSFKKHLERIDYFDDKEIKNKYTAILDNLYLIEGRLAKKAYSNKSKSVTEQELKNALSLASKESIGRALARG